MDACPICRQNRAADAGEDPWHVATLSTGYVRLATTQYFRGATFFAARECAREIYDLPEGIRARHLMEMSTVAEAVSTAFRPTKMNYESLGNGVPHLHWWLTPRYPDEPHPGGPIWEDLAFLRTLWREEMQPSEEDRVHMKRAIVDALLQCGAILERAFE